MEQFSGCQIALDYGVSERAACAWDGSRFIDSLVVSYAATLAALMLIGAVVAKVF